VLFGHGEFNVALKSWAVTRICSPRLRYECGGDYGIEDEEGMNGAVEETRGPPFFHGCTSRLLATVY